VAQSRRTVTRHRLTLVDPPLGYVDFGSLDEAMTDAAAHTGSKLKLRDGRLRDVTGKLRGFLRPIEGPGRPPLLGRARESQVRIKCFDEEREHWVRSAKERGETLADVVRDALRSRYGDAATK